MTMLNGSLDTVALPDVLRLIASSAKSGLLRIEDASPSGRVFIVDGHIAFATTRNENDPIDDLLHMEYRADYVGSTEDRRVVDLNDLMENNPEAFNRFLEQMVVEVMSRLLRVDEGRFRFDVDIRSRREIPHSFEVEDIISQASARSVAWTRIFEVVPSAAAPFRMAPRLHEAEEVALGRRDWALLAATGATTSIDEIAQKLKIFEFAAAKKVAELTQRGLIEFVSTEISHTSVAANELLAGVVEAGAVDIGFAEPESADDEADEAEIVDEDVGQAEDSTEIEFETDDPADTPDGNAGNAGTGEEDGPTWLPVDQDDDNDAVPLLEELHRLHEAQAADQRDAAEAPAEDDEEMPEDAEDAEDAEFDPDDIDGGDLATRWKNLRKAKRGAHASNE